MKQIRLIDYDQLGIDYSEKLGRGAYPSLRDLASARSCASISTLVATETLSSPEIAGRLY